MLRAFFVRIPPPEGTYLKGYLKARVLAFVEPVRQSTGGKAVDEVVIVNDLNAAVLQLARFGLFGPTTNYLILGAPLLQLMNADEVKAVIAHRKASLGDASSAFLEALVEYWGTVIDLTQRQEHGAQKEGSPLTWDDGRRVVFQTACVMFELDRALG